MPAAGVCSSRREDGRMRESLGEKIGEGVSADIHAWAPGAWTYLGAFDFKKRTHAPQYQPVVLQIDSPGWIAHRCNLLRPCALRPVISTSSARR